LTGSAAEQLLKRHAADVLASQPGVIVRAHTILDTARAAWIQAGFSSFEKRLADFTVLNGRRVDYSKDRVAAKPWFRFEPSYDSLASQVQNAVKSNWDDSDTGMVAVEKFSYSLLQNPAYDSLDLNMQPSGNVAVESAVHPVFDVAVGGFGSNVIGANAYFEAGMRYVDHIEIELVLAGFWGMSSYGVQPRLNISKLWNRHWSLQLGYDYLNLSPLKSFNNEIHRNIRIESEERSDLKMNLVYAVDTRQQVSAEFIFGSREFELDSAYYGGRAIKTYPVSPMLHYRYLNGPNDDWFADNGYVLNVFGGFESIGYDDGIIDVVPIYWKLLADARYTISPVSFATFTVAAVGAIERYHDEGHGYVSPKSFEIAPLDVAYRQHAAATPWSTEWYNAELSSHEYAMLRFNGGLHGAYFGAWLFGAYYHDFEDSPYAELDVDKFVLEPALRFACRSLTVYAGIHRVLDKDSFSSLHHLKHYDYFIRIGNYEF
jgi:NTE family protein